MNPTQTLPPGYLPAKTLDVNQDKKTLVGLNLYGLILFVVFGWLFIQFIQWLRPGLLTGNFSFTIDSLKEVLTFVVGVVLLLAVMIVLHEGIHGICFWLFTRSRPKFAFKGAYAYATAPGWYIPRMPYLITALAPFVVISVLCGALVWFAPPRWLLPIALLASLNAGGAVGDLLIAFWLVREPATCLVLDQGDSATLYNEALQ